MNRYRVRLEFTLFAETGGRALARVAEILPTRLRWLRMAAVICGLRDTRDTFRGLSGPDPDTIRATTDLYRCELEVDQVDD